MIVEGENVVRELLHSNYPIEKIFFCDDKNDFLLALAQSRNIPTEHIDKQTAKRMTASTKFQNIFAFVPAYEFYDLDDILAQKDGDVFLVMLDGIEDPHNVGAIIRTAECAGVDAVIVPKNRACPITPTVFKTSAGAIAHTKVCQVTNLAQTIESLKKQNIWVYGLEAGTDSIYDTDLTGNICLVVGSEGFGLSELVAKRCDKVLSLTMRGRVNSLNASNASAIAIYEALRQRG